MKILARKTGVLFAGVIALMSGGLVSGHHSQGMFEMNQTITVKGTVRVFEWTNPHAWLWVTVPTANGGSEDWGMELAALSMIRRTGMSKDSFKPGDRVLVSMHPAREGKGGSFIIATFEDGHTVGRAPGSGPPPATP